MINYLAARKLRHEKRHFDVMRRVLYASDYTIIYFIRQHLALIMFSVFYFNCDVGSYDITQSC